MKKVKTPEFHLSDLKFLTIMKSEIEKKKTCVLHSPSIQKHILGVQDHSETFRFVYFNYCNIFLIQLFFASIVCVKD